MLNFLKKSTIGVNEFIIKNNLSANLQIKVDDLERSQDLSIIGVHNNSQLTNTNGDLVTVNGIHVKINLDVKIDETEITLIVKEILNHYYSDDRFIRDNWTNTGQLRSATNKLIDNTILGIVNDIDVVKGVWQVKTPLGDTFQSALHQTNISILKDIGFRGEYKKEISDDG